MDTATENTGCSDKPQFTYMPILTDAEIGRIHAAAVRVLQEVGFRVQHRELLTRLERRGARVDYATEVFWPTQAMIAAVEEHARRLATPEPPEPVLRRPVPAGLALAYNGTLYYDWPTNDQRPATLDDVRAMLKMGHALPEVTALGPCMTAQDVPPPIEPLVSFAEAIRLTDKSAMGVELILPEQLPYLEELYTIATGQQCRYRADGYALNRFTVDARAAACLWAIWKRNGLEAWTVSSCPVAGASAPVTLAGAIVVALAETLGAWCPPWALSEEVRLGAIPCSGVLDMRTTRVLFATPEAVLIDVGLYQVLDRLYGVKAGMLTDYTDAKMPGMQAVNDKVFKSLAYQWLTHRPDRQHKGMLEGGKAFSPTQLMIDLELNRQTAQLARGVEVSDEMLALEEILECGVRADRSFLDLDHTLAHFREVLWSPEFMDRTCWSTPGVERAKERLMLERAEAKWRAALASYQPPPVPEEKVRAAEAVVARARRALLRLP